MKNTSEVASEVDRLLHDFSHGNWVTMLENSKKALSLAEEKGSTNLRWYAASAVVWLAGSYKDFALAKSILEKYPSLKKRRRWLIKIARNAVNNLSFHGGPGDRDGMVNAEEWRDCGLFIEKYIGANRSLQKGLREAAESLPKFVFFWHLPKEIQKLLPPAL